MFILHLQRFVKRKLGDGKMKITLAQLKMSGDIMCHFSE